MQIRKLYRVGPAKYKSVVVVIPREVLSEVGVESGDYVKVSAEQKRILIEPLEGSRGNAD